MTKSSNLVLRQLEINEIVGSSGKANDRNLSKKSKNAKSGIQTYIRATKEPIFLTPSAKEAFNQLRQAFIKASILRHFDLKCYIWIETNTSGHIIERVLSQLTFDYLTLTITLSQIWLSLKL